MKKFLSMVLAVMMIVTSLTGVVSADAEAPEIEVVEAELLEAGEYASISLDKTSTALSFKDTGVKAVLNGITADGTEEAITEGASFEVTAIGETAAIGVAADGTITPKAKGLAILKATYGELTDSIVITVGGAVVYNDTFDEVDVTKHVSTAWTAFPSNSYASGAQNWIGTAVQSTTEMHSGTGSLDVLSTNTDTPDSVYASFYKADGTKGANKTAFNLAYDLRMPLISANDAWKAAISDMTAVVEFWVKPKGSFLNYDSGNGREHRTNGINISFNGGGTDKMHPLRGNVRSSSDGYWTWAEELTHTNAGGATIVNDKIPFKNEWTQFVIDASNPDGTVNLYIDGQLFRTHTCEVDGCGCKTNRVFNEFQITRNPYATPSGTENGAWVDDIRCYEFSSSISSVSLEGTDTGLSLSDNGVKMVVKGTDSEGAVKVLSNSAVDFEVTKLGEYEPIKISSDGTITPLTGGSAIVKATYTDAENGDLTASVIITVGSVKTSNGFDTEAETSYSATWPRGGVSTALIGMTGTTVLDTENKRSGEGSMYIKSFRKADGASAYEGVVKSDGTAVTDADVTAMKNSRWLRIRPSGEDSVPANSVVEFWFKDEWNASTKNGKTGFYIEGANAAGGDGKTRGINGFLVFDGSNYTYESDGGYSKYTASSVKKTPGWHQVVIDTRSDDAVYMYIDGQEVFRNEKAGEDLFSSVIYKIEYQRHVGDTPVNSAWLDDYVVYDTASTSLDPEGIAVKIEGTSLKGSYKFANNSADQTIVESESSYKYIRYDSKDAAEGTVIKEGTCTEASVPAYELTAVDVGKYFAFEVTPKGGGMTGNTGLTSRIEGPAAPTASNVMIDGRAAVDSEVTGSYDYADVNGEEEAGTTFRWLSADTKDGTFTPVDGATGKTFIIPAALDGKYIKFEVTPKNAGFGGTGAAVASEAVGIGNTPPAATDVKIKGAAFTGSVLEVSYTYSDDDNDKEGATKFQWYVSDTENGEFKAIAGATASQLGLTEELGNKYVLAEVTAVDTFGKAGAAVKSAAMFVKKLESSGDGEIVDSLYVATDGNDANDGTIDKPFATLKAARDAIRAMKAGGTYPATGVTVYIKGGTYVFTETLELTTEDSGEEYAPVTYRPYNDEKVTLTGGKIMEYSKFKAVDGEMKNLLIDTTAQSKVKVANVSDLGIDPAEIPEFKLNDKDGESVMDDGYVTRKEMLYGFTLEMDGVNMPLSRYPNSKYKIDWVSTSSSGSGIKCTDSRLKSWTFSAANGFYARAYWNAEWCCEYAKIGSLDTSTGVMTVTATPNYWISGTKPAQYVNVYEEMDAPGEWFYDRATGNLYIYPIDGATEDSEITMTFLDEALIRMDKTSYVTFYGLDITGGRGIYGVEVSNGTGNVFDGCDFHNFAIRAILVEGPDSRNNVIKNGNIFNCGGGGIRLRGGNSATLERSNDMVTNNKIYDFSLIREGYAPAVDFSYNGDQGDMNGYVEGCGNIVSYNEISDSPHMAIWLRGPHQTVEYNAFHDACYNAQDMGCIYSGCSIFDLGHIVRYNHFYNIGNARAGGSYYPCCYFSDDGSMGGTVYGNTFGPGISSTEMVKVHGGTEFNVYNNVIIDAYRVMRNQGWGASRWYDYFFDGGSYNNARIRNSMEFIVEHQDVYIKDFPWFEKYIKGYENGDRPWGSNLFKDNVMINVNTSLSGSAVYGSYYSEVNSVKFSGNPELYSTFVKDWESGNYSLSDIAYSKIREKIADFPVIPYEAMGPGSIVNKLPVVTSISVKRGAGNVLNGAYLYNDSEKDHEGVSVIKWFAADSDTESAYKEISGQSALDFTYDDSYAGKYIRMEVTPVDILGRAGAAVRSAAVLIAAGTEGFTAQIADAEAQIKGAVAGENLGDYPQAAIDALKEAIEAAKAADTTTTDALNAAVEALNDAVNAFKEERITNVTVEAGTGEIVIPSDLPSADITLSNVDEEVVIKGDVLPKGTITANIGDKVIEITIPEAVTLPGGEFKITPLDETNAAEAGDVTLAVVLGTEGETYSPAINVAIGGILGQNLKVVNGDGTLSDIEGLLTLDQKQQFSLSEGAELVAYGTLTISKDATLSGLSVNGTEIALEAGKTDYEIRLPAGVTTADIQAVPTNNRATVEIPEVKKVPVRGLEIVVTAQSGAKMKYTLNILITPSAGTADDEDDYTPSYSGSTGSSSTGKGYSYASNGASGGIASTYSPYTDTADRNIFTDIIGHWAENDINEMAVKGIVSGVTPSTFEPDRSITRAEFAALMVRALKLTATSAAPSFRDVAADKWYAAEVAAAAEAGLVSGYDGYFRPEDKITREEMAVVIMKAYAYTGKTAVSGELSFSDKGSISDWAAASVKEAVASGLMSGMNSLEFAPKSNATRAQVASLIKRLLA